MVGGKHRSRRNLAGSLGSKLAAGLLSCMLAVTGGGSVWY